MDRKILAIIIVLVSVIGVQTVLNFWLYNQNVLFQLENEVLSADYSVLESDYENLVRDYSDLSLDFSDLQSEYDGLEYDYNDLVSDFSSLSSEYDLLQEDYDSYVDAYEALRGLINLRSLHPTELEKTLITPDDAAVRSVVLSVTGGWSDPSDWDEFWDDYEKLYDWVTDNIEYRSDGFYPVLPSFISGSVQQYGEMWQLPSETLECGKGDCEDMAILLASLLYCYNGKKYDVHCIVVTGHAGVCFPVADDEICILDPAANYYTSSGFPYYNLSSDDIEAEVNYWINTYDLGRVEWIFSSKLWKDFLTTQRFIDWMISEY